MTHRGRAQPGGARGDARRAVGGGRSARHSAVSDRLRALYGAIGGAAGVSSAGDRRSLRPLRWSWSLPRGCPLLLLRLVEEMVRRHAPRSLKLLVLVRRGRRSAWLALTLGLVWGGLAIGLLAAFHLLSVFGAIVLLLRDVPDFAWRAAGRDTSWPSPLDRRSCLRRPISSGCFPISRCGAGRLRCFFSCSPRHASRPVGDALGTSCSTASSPCLPVAWFMALAVSQGWPGGAVDRGSDHRADRAGDRDRAFRRPARSGE